MARPVVVRTAVGSWGTAEIRIASVVNTVASNDAAVGAPNCCGGQQAP